MSFLNWRRVSFNLVPAALLILVAGFFLGVTLIVGQLQSGWAMATGVVVFSALSALHLQKITLRARQSAAECATYAARQRAICELVEHGIAPRDFSLQALQLRDRAIELSGIAITVYDASKPDFPLTYINPAFERMTGYRADEILGTPCRILHDDLHDAPGLGQLQVLLETSAAGNVVLRGTKKDGMCFWSELRIAPIIDVRGVVSHFVAAQTDLTMLRACEEQLQHRAHHDALTGLANRVLLRERLTSALHIASVRGQQTWVLFLGLDRFRVINEISGRDAGDAVLQQLALRLRACVGDSDTASRFGGDAFVVVLQEPLDEKSAMRVIQKTMLQLAEPVVSAGKKLVVGCSIGVAVFPPDGDDAETLIMHAETAMHGAKLHGVGSVHFYTDHLNQRILERGRLEVDLMSALEQDQFTLHYQPQVDLLSGRVVGMEALIRWQHPVHGLIAPSDFISLAEVTGLIVDIGAWVIRTACAQVTCWNKLGFGGLRLSVNLSARQFSDVRLTTTIASVLAATGLDPSCFQLELTESLVMSDVERGIRVMQDLKALGVSLAVDDFGTGYSSLAYLKRLPIDTLKIDGIFVHDVVLDTADAIIVVSIISMAHSLKLRVIAEGVETAEQLDFLRLHQCDEIQGYHFSRPIPAADFTLLLEQKKSLQRRTPALCALHRLATE